MRWIAVLVVLAGCSGGSVVAEQRLPVLVWVDATGAVVGPYSPIPYSLYVDSNGVAWRLDPISATASAPAMAVGYLTADCSGDAYLIADSVAARTAVRVGGETGEIRVVPDSAVAALTKMGALGPAASCSKNSNSWPAIAVNKLAPGPASPPLLPFAPPLRIERR